MSTDLFPALLVTVSLLLAAVTERNCKSTPTLPSTTLVPVVPTLEAVLVSPPPPPPPSTVANVTGDIDVQRLVTGINRSTYKSPTCRPSPTKGVVANTQVGLPYVVSCPSLMGVV